MIAKQYLNDLQTNVEDPVVSLDTLRATGIDEYELVDAVYKSMCDVYYDSLNEHHYLKKRVSISEMEVRAAGSGATASGRLKLVALNKDKAAYLTFIQTFETLVSKCFSDTEMMYYAMEYNS